MGLNWGHLEKVYGITTHRLSQYESKALKGFISEGFPNIVRRIRGQIFIVGPPFLIAYCVKEWGDAEFARLQRKNPADFADDV